MPPERLCVDLVQAAEEGGLMNNVLFSDEVTFHACDLVNVTTAEFGPWNNHMSSEDGRGIGYTKSERLVGNNQIDGLWTFHVW